jgi:hypothetical protein
LVGLVEALQSRGEEPFGVADEAGGLPDLLGKHAADLRRRLGRVILHSLLEVLEA